MTLGDVVSGWQRERTVVACAAGVASLIAAGTVVGFGRPWAVFAATRAAFAVTPDALVRVGITEVGGAAQPVFAAAVAAGLVAGLAGAVPLGRRLADRVGDRLAPAAVGLTQATLLLAVSGRLVSAAVGGVAGGAVVFAAAPTADADDAGRRGLLRSVGTAAAAVGLGVPLGLRGSGGGTDGRASEGSTADGSDTDGRSVRGQLFQAAERRSLAVPGVDGLVSRDFYEVDINAANPRERRSEWELRVTGAVETEQTLDFEALSSLRTEHRFVTLRCVGDPLNGEKLDTALWTGVPASAVLSDVTLESEATRVMVRADDGYYMEFPIEALEDAFLAFGMNGGPLPRAHGAPVRLLVPGHWGEINVKWLAEFEFTTEDRQGYWEKRGWHGTGPVHTVAKLHGVETTDGRVVVGGHAYAGTRGLSAVEVSTDGGETWTEATLSEPLPGRVPADGDPPEEVVAGTATDAARLWRHEYEATADHEVVVRAVEADGTVQPRRQGDGEPFPSGATGWVSETVDPTG
ncbi:molybdopterin-dependent oxidoreductase [Halobaculum sp. MBLA0143]|uniref:molybdopterin-dependent oxidoreductase n=1 Tax=Halobaculum sp. MBLA0143 TaxID=3079933 RepID=UPI00352594E7